MEKDAGASAGPRAAIALVATVAAVVLAVYFMGYEAYRWVKAVHVIAVISWMAGLLYLPRLFIYHAESQVGSAQSETFKVMEGRLLTIIMAPAMVISWVLGLWLIHAGGYLMAGWLHFKLLLALLLSGVHGYLSASARAFREDRNTKPARHWRVVNEVPTLLMIGIVILAIVKPF